MQAGSGPASLPYHCSKDSSSAAPAAYRPQATMGTYRQVSSATAARSSGVLSARQMAPAPARSEGGTRGPPSSAPAMDCQHDQGREPPVTHRLWLFVRTVSTLTVTSVFVPAEPTSAARSGERRGPLLAAWLALVNRPGMTLEVKGLTLLPLVSLVVVVVALVLLVALVVVLPPSAMTLSVLASLDTRAGAGAVECPWWRGCRCVTIRITAIMTHAAAPTASPRRLVGCMPATHMGLAGQQAREEA